MNVSRRCSKTACRQPAVATLTYVYADQAAVLGPLATYAEPHTYDLCHQHATRLTAPRGWEVVRLVAEYPEPQPSTDDLLALADAVREAGRPRRSQPPAAPTAAPAAASVAAAGTASEGYDRGPTVVTGEVRRGHLRMLPSASDS
ncbi:MAG TPA: DUF3499 domain-containing protein [Ornithinibacter sp.]|nr:DUF3499 domain-containing protein [Dermatophilaceae bacterium]HQV83345.1 DUF3499 domain-containing protein [Ornithinibacter sp.]HQW74519.1 DUF3499 domain-containing protein [Ornithinibacter sp.]HQX87880.1 DUF3499 domain-containing protein [Ornithinibacter sp.]HQZ10513.1 DUF3499 domain-containing protein [Ornithinibacter sp.]